MITAGQYHTLSVIKRVEFGVYLDGEGVELLLPKRFVPKGLQTGNLVKVFVYHDSENRLIATTQQPKGVVGDIVKLDVVSVTAQGAFLDWGLMKDLFIPLSQQNARLHKGQSVAVLIYMDQQTGRVAATQKFHSFLDNLALTVSEREAVDLFVFRTTELGYEVIINNKHIGLMHFGDVFNELHPGDQLKGYVKKIRSDKKIDVMPGQAGYKRIENETEKIMRLLKENNDYLPYGDKSDPKKIYNFFGMSKKAFKMAVGALYKQKKISFTPEGIHLVITTD